MTYDEEETAALLIALAVASKGKAREVLFLSLAAVSTLVAIGEKYGVGEELNTLVCNAYSVCSAPDFLREKKKGKKKREKRTIAPSVSASTRTK